MPQSLIQRLVELRYVMAVHAANRRSPNVGSMLAQRLWRWASIEPTLGERLLFAVQARAAYADASSTLSTLILGDDPRNRETSRWLVAFTTPGEMSYNW